jgi:acetyl esterase/lipase
VTKAFLCRPPPSRFRPGPISRSPAVPCGETPRPIRCCEPRRARLASYYLAGVDPRTPYASPLYADLTGLPPTLIQVGSDEILLDDSVRMAERMRAAGCQVELEIWPRMPHTWQVWARVLPEARAAIERIGAFVQSKM